MESVKPYKQHALKVLAVAALLLAGTSAQAAITSYNSQAAFSAAVGTVGVDTFDDLEEDDIPAPLSRSAGSLAYQVDATVSHVLFAADDLTADRWLSSLDNTDAILFTSFGSDVVGAGGYFFGTDGLAFSTPIPQIAITATDSTGATLTQVILAPTKSSFLGFVSDVQLTSLSVTLGVPLTDGWATVNDFQLAVAVPEPGTYAMLLAGLGLLGIAARRRQRG